MAAASDNAVQNWADTRTRVRAEQIRALRIACEDDRAAFDSIYEALTQQNPTWTDNRTDGPPNILTKDDLLAMNAVVDGLQVLLNGASTDQQITDAGNNIAGNVAAANRACVRGV